MSLKSTAFCTRKTVLRVQRRPLLGSGALRTPARSRSSTTPAWAPSSRAGIRAAWAWSRARGVPGDVLCFSAWFLLSLDPGKQRAATRRDARARAAPAPSTTEIDLRNSPQCILTEWGKMSDEDQIGDCGNETEIRVFLTRDQTQIDTVVGSSGVPRGRVAPFPFCSFVKARAPPPWNFRRPRADHPCGRGLRRQGLSGVGHPAQRHSQLHPRVPEDQLSPPLRQFSLPPAATTSVAATMHV